MRVAASLAPVFLKRNERDLAELFRNGLALSVLALLLASAIKSVPDANASP